MVKSQRNNPDDPPPQPPSWYYRWYLTATKPFVEITLRMVWWMKMTRSHKYWLDFSFEEVETENCHYSPLSTVDDGYCQLGSSTVQNRTQAGEDS